MTFEFGPLQLDEPARILRLARREVPLQPRVFDLLVYLVRNRARVVPKDELLDTLWPGVTVTDNSLQRAISVLRTVLREAGMEDAIRNFPRNGYRFCTADEAPPVEPAIEARPDTDALEAAREASDHQRWHEAAATYADAGRVHSLAGDDLDRWALALQCLGRPADAAPLLVRAPSIYGRGTAMARQ